MTEPPQTLSDIATLQRELAERDALLATQRSLIGSLEGKIAALESALVNHASEIELLKRRLFGPRSERGGTNELQLVLDGMLAEQAALQKALDALRDNQDETTEPPPPPPPAKEKAKPKGRRDLALSSLPVVTVELRDETLEKQGAKLIDFEESRQLMFQRGGMKVLLKRTAKYEIKLGDRTTVLGVELPKTLFPRALMHTSLLAWIAVQKFALGVPHYRLEQHLASQGETIDRTTMCRGMEEVGSVLGATVVHAMMRDAIETCSVLSTDATGASIQPGAREGGPKRACKNGHFFTIVADCDHVLFAYTEKHTQAAVAKLFAGFRGYLQADASSVYDILERGPPKDADDGVVMVGCWAHTRRYFFEAAICKYAIGIQGLTRIRAIYVADNELSHLPPIDRKRERLVRVLPLVDDFFAWVKTTARTTPGRNLATRALGYAENQEQELRRVFLDGRLPLDNTRSERALRKVVVGRKNWMFYGSDLHAESAAAIFSIIASCRLHRLDPEQYLDEILRVLAYWPKGRYLELAPKYWAATRATLNPEELKALVGAISVPPLVAAG